ncbi:hypothetical protein OWR29_08065 [Actinoplanes sp. Pm04-4]|uniref:Polyhydroxyalkanoate synthesis regulator phasin n=1 Tax=Paractinoplanes pyxinae TaxID=2997416 RepID=A0ABT4AW81_9ACTN|nr:hypothetical protein [Actinoplanes pyxinae]MCY1137950.1 hypothetical protein [Actinoplanes pyxinae]
MPDAWRAYLEMALGLTEAPRKRAQKVVGDVVNRGGATAAQLQGLVDDLLSAGMANREALTNIVRYEVDKALGVVGLATAEEVTELTTRVRDLERQLREAESRAQTGIAADAPSEGVGGTRIDEPAPRPRAAKKAVAKAVPNAMPSAGTTPSQPPANTPREAPAKKAVAAPSANPPQAAPAKKAVAKKTVAKKAVPPPDEVIPADQKATAKIAPATAQAEAQGARPAKKTAAKKAPAKKAAKKAVAKATPPPPAGTADSPNAAVRDAAAATELPPATEA